MKVVLLILGVLLVATIVLGLLALFGVVRCAQAQDEARDEK